MNTLKNISYINNLFSWKNEFTFYETIKVRFCETDMLGHLNNTVPFMYFEQARINFMKDIDIMFDRRGKQHDLAFVVADLQCDFLQQVYFDETLRVYVKISRIGNSSADVHYMVLNEKDEMCFVGRGTIVQISLQNGKAVAWSEEQKLKLKQAANTSQSK